MTTTILGEEISIPIIMAPVSSHELAHIDGEVATVKRIAEGADLVAIGRPVIYSLALGGSQGVHQIFDFFKG